MASAIDHERPRKASDESTYDGRTEIENSSRQNSSDNNNTHIDKDQLRHNINAKIANPLAGLTHDELARRGELYVRENSMGDEEDIRAFRLGAVIAQDPLRFSEINGLTPEESTILEREITHKWSQPKLLYLVIVLCSICAAVQGMGMSYLSRLCRSHSINSRDCRICLIAELYLDETVVNGAQIFYSQQFGISNKNCSRDSWLLGLVNSAPYLCCAFVGCWLTIPFNNWMGRRGTIFLTCTFSALACIWQAFTGAWWHMFIARFALGLGIGPKSATVPIYAAECAPPQIRGALVMRMSSLLRTICLDLTTELTQ